MKQKLQILLVLGTLLCASVTSAEETAYRSPENFTPEEIEWMVAGMSKYSLCLRDESLKILSQYEDVRQIGEIAMGLCQKVLEALDSEMAEKNVSPEFRKSYITKGRNRSARVMLPEIMQMKAAGY
jgi:hypothetical protein